MDSSYNFFCKMLDERLRPLLDKNIIIYGCGRGGDFIKWFLKRYYGKEIKMIMDRWELSPLMTIPHLWSLYYVYDKDDVILNTTPADIISEFNDTGENWEDVPYVKEQIINLWNDMGGKDKESGGYEITYYDWLDHMHETDLLVAVKRAFTKGEHAHGYFPTDFRIFVEGFRQYDIDVRNDAIFDIGCGKGSGVIALYNIGFRRIGAVEYTKEIYDTMKRNLEILDIEFSEADNDWVNEVASEGVICYCTDAVLLKEELNQYNWFFLFNPFSLRIMEKVLDNICSSMNECPRKVHIFYAEPIGHNLIMKTGLFELRHRIITDMSDVSYYSYIYESIDT